VAWGGVVLASAALAAEATVEQVCCDEHSGAGDAESKFQGPVQAVAAPGDDEDERDAGGDQCEQRFAAMYEVAGEEASESEENDTDGEEAMEVGLAREVADDAGEETDDDGRQQAVDEADGRGGGPGDVGVRVKASDGFGRGAHEELLTGFETDT